MRLFRVADEKVAPAWAFGEKSLDEYQDKSVSPEDIERLAHVADEMDEQTITSECEAIEKCASKGTTYHYNSSWNESYVKQLKEYALACGLNSDHFKAVTPDAIEDMRTIISKAQEARLTKVAAATGTSTKIVLADPFHIDERSELKHMDRRDWQSVEKQSNLADKPSMTAGVRPIRGGEDYNANAYTEVASNQNSIGNPNAIGKMIDSTKLDNGARLAAEKKAKAEQKVANHKEWEKEKIDAMSQREIVATGKVFPTEVMNAQSGVRESSFGVYSKFDPKSMPEKTAGEMLKEQNDAYRKSINPRAEKAKTEFEVSRQAARKISDDFADALKRELRK